MKRGRDEYVPTKIKKTWHRFSLIYYDERRYKNNYSVISVNHNRSASFSVKINFLPVHGIMFGEYYHEVIPLCDDHSLRITQSSLRDRPFTQRDGTNIFYKNKKNLTQIFSDLL